MKTLIIFITALFFLAGCATPASPQVSGKGTSGTVVFGTLAAFGTFEMALAPAYTRLAVVRHNAAQALDRREISLSTAKTLQETADRARSLLDDAHDQTLDGKERPDARKKLTAAQELIGRGESLLEKKQ